MLSFGDHFINEYVVVLWQDRDVKARTNGPRHDADHARQVEMCYSESTQSIEREHGKI